MTRGGIARWLLAGLMAVLIAGCETRYRENPVDAKAPPPTDINNATSTGAGGSSTSGGISSSTSGTGAGGSALP